MIKSPASSALVVALAAWCGTVAADERPRPVSSATGIPSYQDLLFLGEGRPVVIRLHLIVDGEPFSNVWGDYARRLFALADRDGDGSLSREETQSPARSEDAVDEELFSILSLPGLAQADLRPTDGVLSIEEFATFVGRYRGGPFQSPPVVSTASGAVQPDMNSQSTNAGRILFDTLDADRDGRLSREELQTGSESLRKLDFDGDGASSVDELDHLRGVFGRAPNVPGGAASAVPIRALSRDLETSELIQTVVSTYGGTPARSSGGLPITQLGYRDEELARFDADGNERLDRNELRYWLTHPQPHVELVIRIGQRAEGEAAVTVLSAPTLDDLAVRTTELGLVSLVSGNVHLEIGVGSGSRDEESVRQSFTNRFSQSDRNGNGYLEREEVINNPLFEESFNRFDRDGDGKVFEEEMLSVVQGQIIASLSRTCMATANRGKDLFEILDTNRDQRVSRRELLGAVNRFDLWDADENSRLADSEVPQLYQLVFDRGTPELPGFNVTDLPVAFAVPGGNAAATRNAPLWFQRMDRNGDGDVSRREFVGTVEQFEALDRNEDGLIGVREGLAGE